MHHDRRLVMKLFQEGRNIREVFQKKLEAIRKKLSEYDYKQLKEFSPNDIESISMIGLVEEVIIDFDNPIFETRLGRMKRYNHFGNFSFEQQYVEVDALFVDVKIPVKSGVDLIGYQGNPTIFTMSARPIDMECEISRDCGYLTFSMCFPMSDINQMNAEQKKTTALKEYGECIFGAKYYYEPFRSEIAAFNKSLPGQTKRILDEIVKKESALDLFSQAIGVAVTPKNHDREKGQKIVITPKKFTPSLPDKRVYDGYYLDNANYHAILQTIREHLVATETLPKPIQKLSDEELIRDTILWALNANYIVATGETFRAAGKTDINVSFNDKSAFIAECKVWRGPSTFTEALNQVYGYATWRDCRIAILLFNLSYKDFGRVLSSLEEELKGNENYVISTQKSETEWECKFKSKTDGDANITVNVFVADYCLRK